jgi:curved DNA-binding protein CbpA
LSFVDNYTNNYNNKKMNLYQILMVEETASLYQIKEMSDKLTIVFNRIPENQRTTEQKEIISAIKEADLILSDPSKRKEYDAKLHAPKHPGRLSVKDATQKYNGIGNTSPTPRKASKDQGHTLQ